MRHINIERVTARTASGRYTVPEYKVWRAQEVDRTTKSRALRVRVLAVSPTVEELEELFPTAHNEFKHMIDRKTGQCTTETCWRSSHAG